MIKREILEILEKYKDNNNDLIIIRIQYIFK